MLLVHCTFPLDNKDWIVRVLSEIEKFQVLKLGSSIHSIPKFSNFNLHMLTRFIQPRPCKSSTARKIVPFSCTKPKVPKTHTRDTYIIHPRFIFSKCALKEKASCSMMYYWLIKYQSHNMTWLSQLSQSSLSHDIFHITGKTWH